MTSIPELEAQRQKIHATFSKVDAALHLGRITQQEHDALLKAYYGTADEREAVTPISQEMEYQRLRTTPEPRVSKAVMLIIGFCIIMASLFAALFYGTGGITGAVVMEQLNTTYFTSTALPLELTAATRINITGVAQGDGDVTIALLENGQRHPLYEFQHTGIQTAHASMPKSRYTIGETVTYTATDVSSAYLMAGEQAIPLDANATTIENLAAGDYTLKLIINETVDETIDGTNATNSTGSTATVLSQEALRFSVVPSGSQAPSESFNTCGSACDVNITANASLEINISGNATLTLGSIIVSTQGNRPPQLVHSIPDITAEGAARVEIGQAFSDPDGDQLYFDSTHHDSMSESIDAGVLTVSGEPGTYTYIVYASDLHELAPSNIFSITLTAPNTTEVNDTNVTSNATETNATETNAAGNMTLNETQANVTTSLTGNATNSTAVNATTNATAAPENPCSNPDPNMRPPSCIQGDNSSYFKPEEIIIDNKNAMPVGQLTPVGNLLIKGGLVEHSAGAPQPHDYQLGYTDQNGDFVPTLWIDTATGDLHLRGSLTEANGNIPARDNYSAFVNRRGIILALLDAQTGDLIVRGNLVPYRRAIG